jgi:hypothetical protein
LKRAPYVFPIVEKTVDFEKCGSQADLSKYPVVVNCDEKQIVRLTSPHPSFFFDTNASPRFVRSSAPPVLLIPHSIHGCGTSKAQARTLF